MLRATFGRWASVNVIKVDVCVLGGGPAGVAAALRAIDFQKKVCIIEKTRIGGADLWNGALQSKAMWEMAKFKAMVAGTTGGRVLELDNKPEVDVTSVHRWLVEVAETREKQILAQLQESNVQVLMGHGMFNTPHEVEVHRAGGDFTVVHADYFVVCTGSVPREHPLFRSNGKNIVTSDHVMSQSFPQSMVVIGAGVIGCEFATIFANFGLTRVNLIDKAKRILPNEDDDVALFIQQLLEQKGGKIHRGTSLRWLEEQADGRIRYTVKDHQSGANSEFVVERALVSIGRQPQYAGLGLENTKIRIENGRVKKDKFNRCDPYSHIYCCGDAATSHQPLVNVGEQEGRMCIEHMYSAKAWKEFEASNLSTIMFLDQEVAAVGRNERQCRAENIGHIAARYSYEYVSRCVAMNNTKGFVKIITSDDREKRILGVRAVGPHASSVVELASPIIQNQQSAYDLCELLTAYPAVTQGFQECVRMIIGRSTFKPNHPSMPGIVMQSSPMSEFSRGRGYTGK